MQAVDNERVIDERPKQITDNEPGRANACPSLPILSQYVLHVSALRGELGLVSFGVFLFCGLGQLLY